MKIFFKYFNTVKRLYLFSTIILFIPMISFSQSKATNLNIATTVSKIINWDNFLIAHSWVKKTSGVIYFEKDLINNYQQMCNDIYEEPWRLTMIDQESYEISRIKKASPPSYRAHLPIADFRKDVANSAKKLQKYCLSVNLAPVADMGSRGYGNNVEQVTNYTKVFADTMRSYHIIPTWKHFPGMSNEQKSVYNDKEYNSWYKNIYGEGTIDNRKLKEVIQGTVVFSNNNSDLLMFSVGIYSGIINEPVIFSEKIWKLAYIMQPNSLYIPDDLSELNLSEKDILWLFHHLDLLLFTSPKDILKTKEILQKLYDSGEISNQELLKKINRQNNWRSINTLPRIPLN